MSAKLAGGWSRRRWTDEQLRAAVASQRSWRGVARELGLRPTSTVTIRRHAAEQQLDTTHFTGQRPWSDLDLRTAVAQGSSWCDVLRRLGVNNNGDSLMRVRGHAVRIGLDTAHLRPPSRPPLPDEVGAVAPQRDKLRAAATFIALSWFALRGHPTAVPIEPQEYDLLANFAGGIQRVQVKSGTHQVANGRWQVGISRRPYVLDKTAAKIPYDPDSLDYFFIVDGAGSLYLIPSRVVAGRLTIYADHYSLYRVGDASSLLTWTEGERSRADMPA